MTVNQKAFSVQRQQIKKQANWKDSSKLLKFATHAMNLEIMLQIKKM